MPSRRPAKFGTVIGIAPGGVPAHSSHYDSADPSEFPTRRHYIGNHDGIYTGYRFQCVEFARRWLIQTNGLTFGDVGMAYEIFRIPAVHTVEENKKMPVERTANGTPGHVPVLGTIIMWNPSGYFRHTGHVAIVTHAENGRLGVAEQNVTDSSWGGKPFSRELEYSVDEKTGAITIEDNHYANTSVLGWVTPIQFLQAPAVAL